ncbi:hypothetical protein [Hoylesella enoeca]|uniref:Lipoprotein n=1 Tax=Hoylesella enoeca TaxID=76123 RepID=A0A0S2KI35_9BACT|nr:hypothetical protein [Hoylesella enoeca]ALO47981.1 hypothetical protein AS203_01795 [Hoylesella enoeca]
MKDYMKTIKTWTLLVAGLLLTASCANDDVTQKDTETDNGNDKNLTTFVTGAEPTSRTSMDYASGKFYWESGDYIYVQDDDGAWQKSSNAPTTKTAYFTFKVPGKFKNSTTYKVYYPGKNGSNDQVTISAAQTQETPNTTAHFGASGDCGIADATGTKGRGPFNFTLDHQAAYLVFHPYVSNTLLQKCNLTKIEVSSDNDITDTYTLTSTGALTDGSGTGKQIILTTGGSGTYANGFPLNTTSASVTTNGAYMVIKPGTHTLKVRYWLKDVATGIEGTVTKAFKAFNYDVNNYYDIDGNLNIRDYDGDHYYMWDAQEQYWKGHEWWSANKDQPVLNGDINGNFAQSNSDPRYYNTSFPGYGISYAATHASCKDLPNANELSWYCMYGDPRWDTDELWTTMGHLYKGGMWFKKKSVLQAKGHYDTEKSADGTTDARTTRKYYENRSSSITSSGLPSAADAGNYFYLPALGHYVSGQLYYLGMDGYYWSSSADPGYSSSAYFLLFSSSYICSYYFDRYYGYRVGGFE